MRLQLSRRYKRIDNAVIGKHVSGYYWKLDSRYFRKKCVKIIEEINGKCKVRLK